MKQRKEEMIEKCLEAYFHLTIKGEECCLFQDKNGNLHKPHHKEDGMYVFLEEYPKTDTITYVKELHKFCTKIVKYDVMETKELKIQIPEGYEIDKEKSTFEKIVFKKKEDTKPRSWEEYCRNFKGELFFENNNNIDSVIINDGMSYIAKSYLPSKELAEAFLAMMQLMSLRQAWIGDWKPDWEDDSERKWCITIIACKFKIELYWASVKSLSFPSEKIAKDFMNCFKDLLEIAKPLI